MNQPSQDQDLWTQLKRDVCQAWPAERWRDLGIVIGCSGGADSVALLRAICEIRGHRESDPPRGFVVVAHFNHGIRRAESDHDERFVQELAAELGVKIAIGRAREQVSDESSLREARREFFRSTGEQTGARYVAVAHSADDNAETVLHHLMRGTGPAGLAGIRSPRPLGEDLVLVRPLLAVRREPIRGALRAIDQSWREDSSNRNTDYRRNWIRHELIPLIQSQYPQATEAICRASEAQNGWCEWMERLANDWLQTHCLQQDPVRLRRDADTDEAVIIAGCQRLWSQLEWPRGAMSRPHWLRITTTIRDRSEAAYSLPGQVFVEPQGAVIQLSRPGS